MLRPLAVLLLATACAGAHRPVLVTPPDTHREAPPVLFRNVMVFDGIDDFLREPMDVLVVGGRVAGLATAGLHPPPPGVEIVDGTGRTLMPGLVDVHVRIGGPRVEWAPAIEDPEHQAEALLYAGVTTVIVVGHDADLARLQHAIAEGRVAGPRLHRSTRMIVAAGSGDVPNGPERWMLHPFRVGSELQEVDSPLEAARAARRDLEYRDADYVLADLSAVPRGTPALGVDALRAMIAEARQYEKRVCALASGPEDAARAAEAEVAMLLHTPWESVLTDEQVHRIAFVGTPVVTTLQAWVRLLESLDGARPLDGLSSEVIRAGHPAGGAPRPLDPRQRAAAERAVASVRENIVRLYENGVPLLAGSAAGTPGSLHGASIHDEMEALVELGIPPTEVLYMATSAPVRFLDPSARFGVIAPGAYADLLLVEGDPTRDIRATRRIVGVWQAGRRIDRRTPGREAPPP
jgi:imidazolonepropionase-like amidohydrolase